MTTTNLEARLTRVRAARMADKTRFKPHPLGDGYLTRDERWMEVIWAIERRITENLPPCAMHE